LDPAGISNPGSGKSSIPFLDRSADGVSSRGLTDHSPSMDAVSSPCILQRVAAGDGRAMEECVREFGGLIWNLVLRRVKDHSTAEDLTQEIFTEVWKSAGRYDPAKGSESTFVGLIARRRAVDWLRKMERQPDLQPLPDDLDSYMPAASDAAEVGHDFEQVRQAVAGLPEETKVLFSLHFDQGMSHDEIARSTGMALGSVKTRLRRGLVQARGNLQRLMGRGPSLSSVSSAMGDPVT
jgi:RNA polymerase sigma-70 factor (ECF subfamily)